MRLFHCISVCPELTGFENGDIQLTDENFDDSVATFSCNEGYLLNGGSSRRCEAGGWSGATPFCERIGNDILLESFTRVYIFCMVLIIIYPYISITAKYCNVNKIGNFIPTS